MSLSIFRNLFIELPTAGQMEVTLASPDEVLARLEDDFPIHARFDDADLFETGEMLVLVSGPRSRNGRRPERFLEVVVRRPIPIESVPDYLFGRNAYLYDGRINGDTGSSGMLGPEGFRRQQELEHRRFGVPWPSRWTSVLRRQSPRDEPPPPPDMPQFDEGDDIPF